MARPTFQPSEAQRALVAQLASFGIPLAQMSHFIVDAKDQPLSENTLRKHFADELKNGVLKANCQIAECLFRKALKGDTAAMIFWLKTRARWTVTDKVEVSGPAGRPVAIEAAKDRFLAELASTTAALRAEALTQAAES